MELKLFVGKNPNTQETGNQGAGMPVYFGTVVPDHIGDNYAFIESCLITGGKLTLTMDKEPIGVTEITIGGITTAVTYASGALTGTATPELTALFANVGSNTDSIGVPSTPVIPPITPLTGIKLKGPLTGAEGTSGQLNVIPIPVTAVLPTVTYTSDDTAATVDASGKIAFVKGGYVTFTAKAGAFTATLDSETTNNNTTAFVSAEVPVSSGGWHVDVTLSDANGYGSTSAEWELKVNGTVRNDIFVTGHSTTTFQVRFNAGTTNLIAKGDTVLVTHKAAESGIKKFVDQAVTNNLP